MNRAHHRKNRRLRNQIWRMKLKLLHFEEFFLFCKQKIKKHYCNNCNSPAPKMLSTSICMLCFLLYLVNVARYIDLRETIRRLEVEDSSAPKTNQIPETDSDAPKENSML
jgi:hypothetical protein